MRYRLRMAYGGAQEYYGVVPDLAALGKALAADIRLGPLWWAEILDLCNEADLGQERYVWFASTLGGNPVTAAAALATLGELRKPGAYEHLFEMGGIASGWFSGHHLRHGFIGTGFGRRPAVRAGVYG